MNSLLISLEEFIRNRNRRILTWATNAPEPSRVSSTLTASPPVGPKSIRSLMDSGESPGNCQNKCWRRALLDVHIHARRTESLVVFFSDPEAFKRVNIRAFKASSSTSGDFTGLLRIAQYTGICPSTSGSCKTAEKSRSQSLQTRAHFEKTEIRSSSEVRPRKSKAWMEDRTRSLACVCAAVWRVTFSSLCFENCPAASSSAIRTIVSSLIFPAACFALCAVALRDDFDSFRTESGLKTERDLTTGGSGGRGRNDELLTSECGDDEGMRGEGKGLVRDDC